MHVYKACKNSIVILELLPDSINNESRKDVLNPSYAGFRTNKAKVISLVHPITNKEIKQDISIYSSNFVYKIDMIVQEPDFNLEELNYASSEGIHYFKTYEAAISWWYRKNEKFPLNGVVTYWYLENGTKQLEKHYKDGKTNGIYTQYWPNGNKMCEMNFKEGRKDGSFTLWYSSGKIESKGYYKNNFKYQQS
uniref:MORN repeat protein n=1 Tax=Pithovirus LCPAC302 TaxID=2506593 RepID=A0A481Z6W2_9VIRU|nr:MAG: hypothetical protein LCPAC302_02080 [Pithovirus LCPAC302]